MSTNPEAAAKQDFREPTASKRSPKGVADGIGGMILAIAEVAGTPEQTFRALITNEVEQWWKFPGVYRQKDWKADLRVGGRWSVTVEMNDRNSVHAWGEFCELNFSQQNRHDEEIRRSSLSWRARDDNHLPI